MERARSRMEYEMGDSEWRGLQVKKRAVSTISQTISATNRRRISAMEKFTSLSSLPSMEKIDPKAV